MNISVVIPNYNGVELIKKNLPKIFEELANYKNGKTEVIIIDDGSSDKSREVIKELSAKYKNLITLFNPINLGFSPSVNKGVEKAMGDIVILLNTDVYPEAGFIYPLLEHFKDNGVFAVGCLDKSIENGKIVLRGRGLGQWRRGFLVHKRGEVNKTNTLWVSGGSGAFRKSIWDRLGGFNELYNPFYWEDIDLSYRALKSGYKVLFEPKSIVIHEHEKGAIKSKYTPNQIKVISYRNQFLFVKLNATDYNLKITFPFWLIYHFVKALARGDWAFFKGYFSSLVLLPKVIKSSINYQKQFIKKDAEVINNLSE